MKILICDKCEEIFKSEHELKNVNTINLSTEILGQFDQRHLCDNCLQRFNEWLRVREDKNEE